MFILGTGRCGSTLLAEILAAHPDIGCISAPAGAVVRSARALGLRPPQPFEAYGALREQVSPMLADPFRDLTADDAAPWLARRLRRFFETRARASGRPVFMHKFTGWPRARLLAVVFPEASFVHVLRDGRSVASSYLQVPWWQGYRGVPGWSFGDLSDDEHRDWEAADRSWAYLAGLEWKRLMAAFEDTRDEIDSERWLDVRYEDLVARPREVTTSVSEFAGLNRWVGLERHLARVGISEGRTDAYRDELRPEDVALLQALLSPTLSRWGYMGKANTTRQLPSGPGAHAG